MPPLEPPKSRQKTVAAFAVIVIAGLLIATAVGLRAKGDDETASTAGAPTTRPSQPSSAPSTQPVSTANNPQSSSSNTTYKDGTYTATSEYSVPRSFESIKVSLTISGGIVTDSSISNSEGDRESAHYQERFASAYKSYVVGKKVSDIHLSYIAGASDTTDGFNEALTQIRQQAQS